MKPVYAIASNIITSLGSSTPAVWDAVTSMQTGIKEYEDTAISPAPFWASRLHDHQWAAIREASTLSSLAPFEEMALYSAQKALQECAAPPDLSKTVFILASTKGNIEWLNQAPDERINLSTSAAIIARALNIPHAPVVISHACISGVVGLLYALRLLETGRYENAVVTGADRFTRFVLSGFQSFQAVTNGPCRPFDAGRNGINLGEAAATIILSNNLQNRPLALLSGGATSNDANHISGPSRTGEELSLAIQSALRQSSVTAAQIGMISAHGTATIYNDEMEAKAFAHAGLLDAAVHSIKGYTGHTLGAAGVLETAMLVEALQRQQLIPSIGYESSGVSEPLKITRTPQTARLDYVLKTASGFGGCNAALVLGRAN